MKKKHFGVCALCGQESELTFEHIPPRKAFNWFPAKPITGEAIFSTVATDRLPWDFSKLPYNNSQNGIGEFCLCQQCNNNTGTRYGEEYVKFATVLHKLIVNEQPIVGCTIQAEATFRPLPVLKQIISMFCSINYKCINDLRFQLLRQFVLNKSDMSLNRDRFKVGMYLLSSGIQRRCPISSAIYKNNNGYPRIQVRSELAAYPVGFLLYFDPEPRFKMPCPDITGFCNCEYEKECKIQIDMPVYECNIMFPADFRSKQEIKLCRDENRHDSISEEK